MFGQLVDWIRVCRDCRVDHQLSSAARRAEVEAEPELLPLGQQQLVQFATHNKLGPNSIIPPAPRRPNYKPRRTRLPTQPAHPTISPA